MRPNHPLMRNLMYFIKTHTELLLAMFKFHYKKFFVVTKTITISIDSETRNEPL